MTSYLNLDLSYDPLIKLEARKKIKFTFDHS